MGRNPNRNGSPVTSNIAALTGVAAGGGFNPRLRHRRDERLAAAAQRKVRPNVTTKGFGATSNTDGAA
jgi:hypothetical protein